MIQETEILEALKAAIRHLNGTHGAYSLGYNRGTVDAYQHILKLTDEQMQQLYTAEA